MKVLLALWHQLWITLVVALVLLALYTSLGRQLVPMVETLQPDLERVLSERLGRKVTIEAVGGGWNYLSPVLRLEGVSIGLANQKLNPPVSVEQPYLESLEFELDVSASAYHLKPVFKHIKASGLTISLQQLADGRWLLGNDWVFNDPSARPDTPAEEKPGSTADNSAEQPAWLQLLELQQRLELANSLIRVYKDGELAHRVQVSQLLWRHQGNSQAIRGQLELGRPGQSGLATVSVNAVVTGALWPWKDQQGELIAHVEPQPWASWIPDQLPADIRVNELVAGGDLWLKIRDGDLSELLGSLDVVKLSADTRLQPIQIDQGRIELGGRHAGEDWHVRVRGEDLWPLPVDELTLSSVPLPEGRGWQLGIPKLNVGKANRFLLDHGLLPAPFDRYLDNIDPLGFASDLRVSLFAPTHKEIGLQVDVRGDLEQVSGQPYRGIPGIEGLDAQAHLQPRLGKLTAAPQSVILDLEGVYEQPWPLQEATGDFYWSIQPDASQIWLDRLSAQWKKTRMTAVATMELPSSRIADAENRLKLVLGIPNGHVLDKERLLPDLIEPEVRDWILASMLDGDLSKGALLVDGVMDLEKPEGSFSTQLYMDVTQGRVRYLEGWPDIVGADARFFLDVPDVDVEVQRMQTLGGQLVENTGRISLRPRSNEHKASKFEAGTNSSANTSADPATDEAPIYTDLKVSGKMQGPLSEGLAYFQETPLQTLVNNSFDDWLAAGDYQADMKLDMLLGPQEDPEAIPEPDVLMRVWLADNQVHLSELDLTFNQVTGVVDFDSSQGLFSDQLSAQLFGGPVSGTLTSSTASGAPSFATQVKAQGRAHWDEIKAWMPNVLLAPVTGDLGYAAEFRLDTVSGNIELDIDTPLDGTLIDYPEPFYKAADDQSQPLSMSMSISPETLEPRVWMNYNNRIKGLFALNEIGVDRGQVYVGNLEPYLPSDPGVVVVGHLDDPLIAEVWWDTWTELQTLGLEQQYQPVIPSGASAEAIAVAENPVRSVQLSLSNMVAWTVPMKDFEVEAHQEFGEWHFDVKGQVVAGQVKVPLDIEQPVEIQFDYVHLPPAEEVVTPDFAEQSSPDGEPDYAEPLAFVLDQDLMKDVIPSDLLPMNVDITEYFIGGLNFGRWQLQSRPIEDGIAVRILDSDMKGMKVTGDFRWLLSEGQHRTFIDQLQIKAKDLDKVQSAFRQDPMVDAKTGRANMNVSWVGSPLAFNPYTLNGVGSIRLENGVWRAEGAGALKAFGLLNFNTISRRLQLDFSDLYESGVAFDLVRAQAKFENGHLTLTEPFISDGPGAKFLMSGETNLIDQSLDMKLAVTFPVTGTLPLVAILAGFAPPVAAGIYVTEKLIGDELERFTSASYDVRGTWTEPDMEIREAFDNKVDGKKSKSLKDRVLSIFGLDESD